MSKIDVKKVNLPPVTVNPNNPNTQSIHTIFLNENDTSMYLKVRFKDWGSKKAKKIEIVENSVTNLEIIEFETLKKKECDSNNKCNEFQIKAKAGTTSVGKIFKISPPCDFSKNQVVLIQFTQREIDDNVHKKKLCSDCYDGGSVPQTSKGNIIVGGD